MAEIATIAALTGGALGAAGALHSGQVGKVRAENQRSMARFNAAIARREARSQSQRGELLQRRQFERSQRALGELRAQLGGAGVATSAGAPVGIVGAQAEESELESLLLSAETQATVSGLETQARLQERQARLSGQRAWEALFGSRIAAGSSLLRGFTAAGVAHERASSRRRADRFRTERNAGGFGFQRISGGR